MPRLRTQQRRPGHRDQERHRHRHQQIVALRMPRREGVARAVDHQRGQCIHRGASRRAAEGERIGDLQGAVPDRHRAGQPGHGA